MRNVDPSRKLTEQTQTYLEAYAGTRVIPEWNDGQSNVKKIINFINYCIRQEKAGVKLGSYANPPRAPKARRGKARPYSRDNEPRVGRVL